MRAFAFGAVGTAALFVGLVAACSSDDTKAGTAPTTTASAICAAPGAVTPGTSPDHCSGKFQAVLAASCAITDAGIPSDDGNDTKSDAGDAGDAGAGDDDDGCDYGAPMFGMSGNDDDCKYIVTYAVDTPICEGTAGVQFTVTVKNAIDNTPVTDAMDGIEIEAFIPTDQNAACSTTTHPSPSPTTLTEAVAGSGVYKGPVVFDAPGEWTVRFHIHEECADTLDTSPHGHAAFHITVP